ncbi:MAG: hypothetical protein VYD55_05835, partial [Chloroflexota bacterium]|nr:hypothetical protein [Chloroflexota bacterium]
MAVSDEILARYRKVAVATIYSAVRELGGYEPCFMRGVKAYTSHKPENDRLAGRAKTLRFVPPRKDIKMDTQSGEQSPEYIAMGSCGPGDVAIFDAMGRNEASIGGDVKLIQLKNQGAEGLVTDGSIRDINAVKSYGFKLFAAGNTARVGEPDVWPYEANGVIQCGGVTVRPGDVIVGDDDGVVVVPERVAEEIIEWAEDHEKVEEQ